MSHPKCSLRLDRPLLWSNLISGAVWLFLLSSWSGPALSLIGAVYVVAGSLFFGAVYAHKGLTITQEALAWFVPWFVAVALWAVIVAAIEAGNSGSNHVVVLGLYAGLLIATPSYVVWQIVALAVRHFMAWRSHDALRVESEQVPPV